MLKKIPPIKQSQAKNTKNIPRFYFDLFLCLLFGLIKLNDASSSLLEREREKWTAFIGIIPGPGTV
jgi:hypothetical protein